jgi:poly(hydroxyalkanoate) granule-associated protein
MSDKNKFKPENLKESAEKVWLAGMGALATGQDEGKRIFRDLVEKGKSFEAGLRGKSGEDTADATEDAGDKSGDTWDHLEKNLKGFVDSAMKYVEPVKKNLSRIGDNIESLAETIAEEMGIADPEDRHEKPEEPEPVPEKGYGMRHVGAGWYELTLDGKVIKKVRGKDVASANLKAYLSMQDAKKK